MERYLKGMKIGKIKTKPKSVWVNNNTVLH